MRNPTDHFDPKEWADIYDSQILKGEKQIFRRSRDLALEVCLQSSKPGQLWIEVGCGTGHLGADLNAAGLRIIGFDHDIAMIRVAQQKLGNKCFIARAPKFPIRDCSADGMIAVSFIGCLNELQPFLLELHRVLKPDGFAVLTFTNRSSHLHRINRLIRKPDGFYRAYSLAEVRSGLGQAGLQIQTIRFYNFFLDGSWALPGARISKWAETASPKMIRQSLGRNLLVLAKRV